MEVVSVNLSILTASLRTKLDYNANFELVGTAAGVVSIAQIGAQLSLALYNFADTVRSASQVKPAAVFKLPSMDLTSNSGDTSCG